MRIIASNNKLTVYHGDDFNTSKIDYRYMNNGNNELGIGIYFGNLQTAQAYGKDIVSTEIDPKKFVEARGYASDYIKTSVLAKFLKELHKLDNEPLYYYITDFGVEANEPEDIEDYMLEELAENIIDEEIRNLQIDLAQKFDHHLKEFVHLWNKIIKIDGTKMDRGGVIGHWFCIINPKYKLTKVKV